jgi:hypothetical protein
LIHQEFPLPYNNRFFSIYRGICVKNDDPLALRRIKVRVYEVYGNEEAIADEDLPWAWPCLPPGNAPTPNLGDKVWVMFEQGNSAFPVWLGIFYTQ